MPHHYKLNYPFSDDPSGVFAVPQEIAVDVGLLERYTDLVAVEVVGLLVTTLTYALLYIISYLFS